MKMILIFIVMVPVVMMLNAFAFDYELASNTFFEYKGHLNRAVHAASLQRDEVAFSEGIIRIDFNEQDPYNSKAFLAFEKKLMENMRLEKIANGRYRPKGGSIENEVTVLWFEVYNGVCDSSKGCMPIVINGKTFVKYEKPEYNFETILARPGVMAIVHVDYKETFSMIGDISWAINASHELVY